MNKNKIATILIMLIICLTLIQMPQAHADAIDNAIVLAQDFLDRAYHELNSTHAVCKRHPSIPIRVYCETLGHWVPLCKESLDVQSIAKFKGGCKIEPIKSGHAFVFGDNNERWYKFDCDNDGDYDDLILWAEDTSSDNENVWVHIAVKNNPQYTCDIYLGDEKIIDNAKLDDGYTTFKHRGWFSQSYDLRHATRLMQWYYEDRYAETGYTGWLERANRLKTTMDSIGYTNEFFAPLWNKSNSYTSDDFPEWSQYPDYQLEDKWLYNDQAIPYHSHLADYWSLSAWFTGIVPQGNAMWDLVKATHLMNKYGTSKINDAKQLIDKALWGWDGYGIKKYQHQNIGAIFDTLFGGYEEYCPTYQSYTTAIVSIACGRYYQLTGDTYYRDICREAIGVILKTQLTNGKIIFVDNHGSYYSADSIGGFLIHYTFSQTFHYKAQTDPFIITHGTRALQVFGQAKYDKEEYQSIILTNTETTLICWKALKFLKTLGLTPIAKSTIEDWNGLTLSWIVQHNIPEYYTPNPCYPKAFNNGYFTLCAWRNVWANETMVYQFTPKNTICTIELALTINITWFWLPVLGYVWNPLQLKLLTKVKDLTTNQIVSTSETLLWYYNYSKWKEDNNFENPYLRGVYLTIPIRHTLDLTHNYQLYTSILGESLSQNYNDNTIGWFNCTGRLEAFMIRPRSTSNAQKILRPSVYGDVTQLKAFPSDSWMNNYKHVNEIELNTTDGVRTNDSTNELMDLYFVPLPLSLPDTTEIDNVTVAGYFYTGSYPTSPLIPISSAKILMSIFGSTFESDTFGSLGTTSYDWTWQVNPCTGHPWTIPMFYTNTFQIGFKGHSTVVGSGSYWAWQYAKCYQLWVVINYKIY